MVNDEKQKLTLGLSKEVIGKARALGLNISSVTEQLLRAITLEPKGNTKEDVLHAYESLLGAAKPLLQKYGASVIVGRETVRKQKSQSTDLFKFGILKADPFDLLSSSPRYYTEQIDIFLDEAGYYKISDDDKVVTRTTLEREVHLLFKPLDILRNLIESLVNAAENNSRQMNDFKIALKIVSALSEGQPPEQDE